jgi:myo-inositol-1(or 4)-monophosphatase
VLALFIEAAREAGDAIAMSFFRQGYQTTATVRAKLGGSPVTEADLAVDRFLFDRLTAALPRAAWLSEETADSPERLTRHDVLVVDPIDGTRAFMAGLTSWAISIALVSGERPVVGVVYVPALGRMYQATTGGGASCNGSAIAVSNHNVLPGARLAGPQTFVGAFAARGKMIYVEKVPSLACRFVRVAEGEFDVGISSSNAHDWDLAAADLILEEAGGILSDGDGTKLAYNKAIPRHPPLFGSSRALHPALLQLVRTMPRASR